MTSPVPSTSAADLPNLDQRWCVRRHLRAGWWTLAVFIALGAVLESLHGFKVAMYLNTSNETRRLLWTLAHAHGTLLGLLNIAFACTVSLCPGRAFSSLRIASGSLLAATVLLPAGFFLGGVYISEGDPGLAITLVPPGAVLLLVAVVLTAVEVTRADDSGTDSAQSS